MGVSMGDSFHHRLYPGGIFHVYNRGNNKERLFYREPDYEYFLKKYWSFLRDCVDTLAYCLNRDYLLERFGSLGNFVKVHTDLETLARSR